MANRQLRLAFKVGIAALVAAGLSACTVAAQSPEAVPSAGSPDAATAYFGPPVETSKADPVYSLEGGMPIYVGSGADPVRCTAGFPLVGLGGIRYYLVAGHCARGEKDAPVFADVSKLVDGKTETSRVQIGKITENQYPPEYRYDSSNPAPFPDLAVFSANTKTWPAPATSLTGGKAISAGGFPPESIMGAQENGQPWCWPVAQKIGYRTECGDVQWVKDSYVGIKPKNPDWAADIGNAYPGTPVWSVDSGSKLNGTVGIMSLKLENGIYVTDTSHAFIDNRYIQDSAIGAKMPDGYVPNPPLFSFPK